MSLLANTLQLISNSVANALEFCSKEHKDYQGCDATIRFIRIFNDLFDIFNSRNPYAKGTKSAMRLQNKEIWYPFLDKAYKYILGLKDSSGKPICTTQKKNRFCRIFSCHQEFSRDIP